MPIQAKDRFGRRSVSYIFVFSAESAFPMMVISRPSSTGFKKIGAYWVERIFDTLRGTKSPVQLGRVRDERVPPLLLSSGRTIRRESAGWRYILRGITGLPDGFSRQVHLYCHENTSSQPYAHRDPVIWLTDQKDQQKQQGTQDKYHLHHQVDRTIPLCLFHRPSS